MAKRGRPRKIESTEQIEELQKILNKTDGEENNKKTND